MAFTGTLDKCKICDKTVYVIDLISADGVPYHKTCFKCSHCNGKLVIGKFSSWDGDLLCMPHYEQRFRETGRYPTKKQSNATTDEDKAPSKFSSMFSGTQDKCNICKKTVYPLEKIVVEGENYHKPCFRCAKGGCLLTTSNYAALDGILYCKPHFAQLFKEKGSYNNFTKSTTTDKADDTSAPTDEDKPEEPTEE